MRGFLFWQAVKKKRCGSYFDRLIWYLIWSRMWHARSLCATVTVTSLDIGCKKNAHRFGTWRCCRSAVLRCEGDAKLKLYAKRNVHGRREEQRDRLW